MKGLARQIEPARYCIIDTILPVLQEVRILYPQVLQWVFQRAYVRLVSNPEEYPMPSSLLHRLRDYNAEGLHKTPRFPMKSIRKL